MVLIISTRTTLCEITPCRALVPDTTTGLSAESRTFLASGICGLNVSAGNWVKDIRALRGNLDGEIGNGLKGTALRPFSHALTLI